MHVVHGALRTAIAGIHRSGTDSFFRISRKLNEINGYMYRKKLLEILSFTTYSKIIDIGENGIKIVQFCCCLYLSSCARFLKFASWKFIIGKLAKGRRVRTIVLHFQGLCFVFFRRCPGGRYDLSLPS